MPEAEQDLPGNGASVAEQPIVIVTDLMVIPSGVVGAAGAEVPAAAVDVVLIAPPEAGVVADVVLSAPPEDGAVAVSSTALPIGDAGADAAAPSASAGAGTASQWERLRPGPAGASAGPRPRDPAWQQERRQRAGQLRGAAADLVEELRHQGASATAAAALLGVPARTLRSWLHDRHGGCLAAAHLGRPHARCSADQGSEVLGFLQQHGPWVGLPSLRGAFPKAPRAELSDLLAIYRHLWAAKHPRAIHELCWLQPGSVWAIDFTEVSSPIDGCFPYVFAVRDLSSGLQLSWQPVADVTTETAVAELQLLFLIHGAPLVLKSDNGSAFRAGGLKRLLGRWQVWPLYSPPGKPGYNGAIEASIGALKKRTAYQAERAGHAEV